MSEKLQPFTKLQTGWLGLWYHPEYGGFSSEAIDLTALKVFKGPIRLYIRKNRYYDKNSNTPNYVFSIQDANARLFRCAEIKEDNRYIFDILEDCDDLYLTPDDAVREVWRWYDGPNDPCDIWTHGDFENLSMSLSEIIAEKIAGMEEE